ncbi:DUF2207 domain-containing protein [Archangium minus]
MGRSLSVAVCCVLLLLTATPAAAQDSGWVIKTFDVQLAVQANADVLVTEDIAVDFGSLDKHGIYRDIPIRYGHGSTQERRIRIEDAHVQGDPGTPDQLAVLDQGHSVRLRIGSPDKTVSGPHRYRLTYRVVGAMNAFETHAELYWNVTGTEWGVPLERVTARITGPAAVTRVACYTGPTGSTKRCPEANIPQSTGRASAGPLNPGEGMAVVAAFPAGSVQVPPPELVSQLRQPVYLHDPGAHAPTAMDLGIAALLSVLMGVGLVRLYQREGKDEPAPGPITRGIEDRPPNGLRPAQLSFLIHKRIGTRDIAATLVDLAVRGYLSIEQLPKSRWNDNSDWRLTRRTRQEDRGDPPLTEYERELYSSLFAVKNSVLVSEHRGRISLEYRWLHDLLHADPEVQSWFPDRPDRVRTEWVIRALFLVLGSLLATGWAWKIHYFDVAVWLVPFVLGGLVLGCLALRMPRRTSAGSAMLQRALDFRAFIFTAEMQRTKLARQQDLFSELLPYAIAFGAENRWALVFSELSAQALTRTAHGIWYTAAPGSTAISALAFADAVHDFGSSFGGTLAGTGSFGASGGSGFSGGGGYSGGGVGGGGGGGW